MIRLLYNLLFPFALILFLPRYFLKARRRGNYRRNFGQRFAIYDRELRARLTNGSFTWIHAVSVGEVVIALKLARKLRELEPGFRCALTTTTTTGYAVAMREAPQWMEVLYNPLDFWPIMQRAFATIRPVRIVLVEAEVWPNLAAGARARSIPISLVNARLSQRSERRFHRCRAVVAPIFRCLDLVCVQEPEDVERWASIGVRAEVIRHTGSIKYDPIDAAIDLTVARQALDSLGIPVTRPILLGGSTHAGEEEILARTFLRLRAEMPNLFLIIAPRHVERVREVHAALQQLGLAVSLRSDLSSASDCLLIDTTGELRSWYAVATIVFIGKSLAATGGQNPVEPILADKPVVFGSHMENFAALCRALVSENGAIQIGDAAALERAARELLADANARAQLVANARRVLVAHRGATQRTAELVLACKSLAPA